MNWKGWLAIAGLLAVIAAALWISHLRTQNWLLQDKERIEEIQRHRFLADQNGKLANEAIVRSNTLQRKVDALQGRLDASTKRIRSLRKPATLAECEDQIVEFDAHAIILRHRLDLEKAINASLGEALDLRNDQVLSLGQALNLEQERSESFQKVAKREKIKKVFIGVGSGAGGILLGLGIGAAVSR